MKIRDPCVLMKFKFISCNIYNIILVEKSLKCDI